MAATLSVTPTPRLSGGCRQWRRHVAGAMLMVMWWTLFRGGHWSDFSDFVSPALFEVMGGGELAQQLKTLASGYWERERWATIRQERAKILAESGVPVELSQTRIGRFTRREDGDEILALYFHQLFAGRCTLLDLRRSSFRVAQGLKWDPGAFCVEWEPGFLSGLRDVYTGFYTDDEERYQAGLSALGLQRVSDVFFAQFRPGDSGMLAFSLAGYRHAFHEVFVRCRDTHTHLHPNFVALGVYLACLYEHLEELGGGYDVRAAFARGRRNGPMAHHPG